MSRRHVRKRCVSSCTSCSSSGSGGKLSKGAVTTALRCLLTILVVPNINAKYPQDALQCIASLKEPDGLLICPEHRNGYCVKEVSTLAQEDCGRTGYFGDKWNPQTGKCEYRKCEAACLESSWDFEFEGEAYERNRFCCNFNFCNGATRHLPRPGLPALITGAVALLLVQTYFGQHQAG